MSSLEYWLAIGGQVFLAVLYFGVLRKYHRLREKYSAALTNFGELEKRLDTQEPHMSLKSKLFRLRWWLIEIESLLVHCQDPAWALEAVRKARREEDV